MRVNLASTAWMPWTARRATRGRPPQNREHYTTATTMRVNPAFAAWMRWTARRVTRGRAPQKREH